MTSSPGGPGRAPRREEGSPAAAARIRQQGTWVDLQLRRAVERGDFDDLPGYGKPLDHLTGDHDPDWWVKQLVERERITVLPPSVQLRRDDEELDGQLDLLSSEAQVRRAVEDFNARVRWALYRPPEGPPVVTPARDPEVEVARWQERRRARSEARRATAREAPEPAHTGPRGRWGLRWRPRPRPGTRPGPTDEEGTRG
jgi:hypothetical protein